MERRNLFIGVPMMQTLRGCCLFLGGLLLLVSAVPRMARAADRPPNVLIVLADDLGAKELGCYGHAKHRTPNLDRLASDGMRFETCYATPLCTPTRVMLMTGQYAFRTGYFNLFGQPLTPRQASPNYDIGSKLTFADVVKTKGYVTGLAGKWQLTGKVPTLVHDCGFDEYRMWAYQENLPPGVEHTGEWENKAGKKTSRYWHPSLVENGKYLPTKPTDYGPDLFNQFAIDFMRRHKDEPWCFYYTHPLTHGPHVEVPDVKNPGQRLPGGFASNLEYLDHLLGQLVAAIDEQGQRERTVIIFVGDNGTGGDGKNTVTELGCRVPLIVRGPQVKVGVVSRELVSVSDIFPTVADYAQAKVPEEHKVDGVSLVPTLRGDAVTHREWLFSYLRAGKVLRDRRWLLEDAGTGTPKFFDCGEQRDGKGYRDVTDDKSAEVVAARQKFAAILKALPGPESHDDLKPAAAEEGKKNKNKNKNKNS